MKSSLKFLSLFSIVSATLLLAGPSARAASQTWTNAPVSQIWTNTANWAGGAYPGVVDLSNNTTVADIATFNTPIPISGIGGASLPIITTDCDKPANSLPATNRCLQISGITFDTANCGAYVFQAATPVNYPTNGILNVSHNGSITMNATVNNSQTFLVPVFIRLPSSTAGIYNFVNNSANPAATLYFNCVTNDSANSRGTTFVLGGSNTGTNTIQFLSKGATTSGAMGVTKQGTGIWLLPNASDFPRQAVININDGTLEVFNSACWGLVNLVTVNSNAVEELINAGQTNSAINGNGTILMSGTGDVNLLTVGAGTGVTPHLNTTSLSDVLTVGGTTSVAGGSATSVIHIGGPGAVLLLTNSTYNGNWSADSGALQIGVGATNALGTGPNVNISAGGTLDLTTMGAGVTFNPSTAGIGASGTGTTVGSTAATIKADAAGTIDLATGAKNISLTYAPTSFAGDASHPALYISQGTLSIGGNTITVNNVSGTPLGAGTYLLIQQASGNVASSDNLAANVTGSGVATGNVGTIQVSGGQVSLVVAVYVQKHLVWQGGNPNKNWDVNTTPNWFNGAASSVFNNSDFVTFNAAGASNPIVNLVGSLIPSSSPGGVLVDTTSTNYVFSGGGSISGTASLTKMGAGTLVLSNVNDYLGSTVISNGTVQLGTNNALSGNSDTTISNGATVDLNSWSTKMGALNGNGTIDTSSGGTPTLTVGNNADSGSFSGIIMNTAGTLALIKGNIGSETLSGSNSYAGATTVNGGILRAANPTALGTGAVTVNSGTFLDVSTSLSVGSIAGTGTIENNSTTTTNELIVQGTSTFAGTIADGSGGGGMSVLVSGGRLTLNTPSTYSGGTIVASGATLAFQNGTPNGVAGSGGITLSNTAAVALPGTGGGAVGVGNTITTVNNALATFTSANTQNGFTGSFAGGITATDMFVGGTMTIGGNGNNFQNFSNFLGTVLVTNGTIRGFGTVQGGQHTLFNFVNAGAYNSRDGNDVIHFGALEGDFTANIFGATGGGSNPQIPDNYYIGEANADCTYSGNIGGTNNIVKSGTGTLTLDGGNLLVTNTVTVGISQTVNIGYGQVTLTYVGSTTVSNGTLALVGPMPITNSSPVTLASAAAVIDATSLGYISNLMANPLPDGETNEVVTNSIFEVAPGQTLAGFGTVKGFLQADPGSVFNVGLPTGAFNVTSNATLSGLVNISLDTTDAPTCGELVAPGITVNPSASLVVTNTGPGILNNTKFTLFNHPVSFASVTLPAKDPTGSSTYIWKNELAINGSITLTNGGAVAASPAKFTGISVNGLALTITATNGAANGTYRLLESTNLLVPVAQWTPVLTNSFDGSGNLNLTTNVVNPARPQMYYLLLMP
jgi:autotransporter-associated beta strand protein